MAHGGGDITMVTEAIINRVTLMLSISETARYHCKVLSFKSEKLFQIESRKCI